MASTEENSYKLRATLTGHSGDVRTLCTAGVPNEAIVSGSRDKTAVVWMLEGDRFVSKFCYKLHEKYISSVGWMPSSSNFPQGLILTGSHDKLVHVFDPLSPSPSTPSYTLSGHKDTVSSIRTHPSGMVLTGSWDGTAKLWQIELANCCCVATLDAHLLAVWTVEFVTTTGNGDGDILLATGSADKTLRLWSKDGKPGKVLKGHTDVVRGVVNCRPNELLSCANDAQIRHWDVITGECRMVYYGHANYIYSIALLGNHSFATSSEDASVRIWNLGNPDSTQTIRLPARSIWAVTTLINGDIVAGGSDNQIRIFTRDNRLIAPADELKKFTEELATMEHSTKEVLDGVKTEDLPTDTALYAPGEKDGQTKIIRKDGKVEVYSWSASEASWQKIGDVVGSSGGTEKTANRTLYQGKEYDFVFSVDFDESKPPVKLPYNRSDDPWIVAHQFLETNELPASYLETVAKFIIQNVPDAGATAPKSTYNDPFTGGGRYIPGGGAPLSGVASNGSAGYRDPFTGGNAYVSGGSDSDRRNGTTGKPSVNSVYYPVKEYIGFHVGNVDGILKKLKEHMEGAGRELVDADLAAFRSLMQKDVSSQPVSLSTLNTLGMTLDLSDDKIFPALDLLRFAIRHADVCDYFCGVERSAFFIDFILPFIQSNKSPANQQLTLKIISNIFFGGKVGKDFLMDQRKRIWTVMTDATTNSPDKNVQIARSSVLLNYSVCIRNTEEKLELLYAMMEIGRINQDPRDDEALFRLLVALGTLLSGNDEELKGYAKALDLMPFGNAVVGVCTDERVKTVWRDLHKELS